MLPKLIFLVLIKNVLTDNTNTNPSPTQQPPAPQDQNTKKVRVGFIEDVEEQTYLEYLHEDDVYSLDLYNFFNTLKSTGLNNDPEATLECPSKVYENFKMKGFYSPLTVAVPITECPNMKNSCCGDGDLQLLREAWDLRYSRHLKFNQYYFKYYVMTILQNFEVTKRVAEVVNSVAKDRHCTKVSEKILAFKINDQYVEKVGALIDGFLDYDQKLKHSFVCFMCDYESFKNWDTEGKTVALNYKLCDSLVENTMDYYYTLNTEVYKYINTVNFLTKCVSHTDPKLMGKMDTRTSKSTEFLEVDGSMYMHQCKLAKDKKYNLYNNCLNFCSKVDFWSPGRPMYRSVYQLAAIFGNLKEKIFQDVLKYDVSEPGGISALLPIFEVKYDDQNIFESYDRVFMDKGGILPDTLLGAIHY